MVEMIVLLVAHADQEERAHSVYLIVHQEHSLFVWEDRAEMDLGVYQIVELEVVVVLLSLVAGVVAELVRRGALAVEEAAAALLVCMIASLAHILFSQAVAVVRVVDLTPILG